MRAQYPDIAQSAIEVGTSADRGEWFLIDTSTLAAAAALLSDMK